MAGDTEKVPSRMVCPACTQAGDPLRDGEDYVCPNCFETVWIPSLRRHRAFVRECVREDVEFDRMSGRE